METLFFLARVNFYWVLFYAFYWLLLSKNTFFHLNRFYLLGALLVSFLLPLIHFNEVVKAPATFVRIGEASDNLINVTNGKQSDWASYLLVIYAIGFAFMFYKFVKGFYNLYRLIQSGESIKCPDYTLIILPETKIKTREVGSFSFFNWLIVSHKDYDHYFDPILRHEQVHIRQKHSWDIMLIEILKVLFWFNPALWCYKFSMRQVHEFLADQQVENRDFYAEFLVRYAQNTPVDLISNHFFNSSLLKDRIQMIYKIRTSNLLLYKYAVVIPVIAFTLMMTASRKRIVEVIENQESRGIDKRTYQNGSVTSRLEHDVEKENSTKQSAGLSTESSSKVIKLKRGKSTVIAIEDTIQSKKRTIYFVNYKIIPVELEPLNTSFPGIKQADTSLSTLKGLFRTTGFYNNYAPQAPLIDKSQVGYKFWIDRDTREQLQIDSLKILNRN